MFSDKSLRTSTYDTRNTSWSRINTMATSQPMMDIMMTSQMDNVTVMSIEGEQHRALMSTNIVLATIVGTSCFLGLVGNALVVVSWLMSKKLQTITNIFVISLSITDFLGCAMLPIQVLAFTDFEHGRPVPSWVCQMCGALCLIAFKSSVIHLAMIGINRYVVITRFRAQYLKLYSARNVVIMVLFAWTFPILLIMLPPAVGLGRLGYNAANQLCVFDGTPLQLRIIYILEEILFGLSFIIILVCYLRIYIYVSRQHRDLIYIYSRRERSAGNIEFPSTLTEEVTTTTEIEPSTSTDIEPSKTTTEVNVSTISNIAIDVSTKKPPIQNSSPTQWKPSSSPRPSTCSRKKQSTTEKPRRRTASCKEMQTVLTKREVDITKNLFTVVVCFFVFVFPHILCLTSARCYTSYFKYTATILVINSCTNPIIYCLKHPTFREVSSCLFRGELSRVPHPSNWLKRLLVINR